METDKHYFFEGLFIIVFAVGIAFFFVWVANAGHRDDITYRIHFAESVNGLALGDPVKFRGVDVGTVKSMAIDPDDPRLVQVDVRLRKDAPIKTDTKAVLKLKGITGVMFIELDGGSPEAPSLASTVAEGQIPEIPSEKSTLTTFLDELPKVVEKFGKLEDKASKVVADVGGVTGKIKENPSVLIWGSKDKGKEKQKEEERSASGQKSAPSHNVERGQ
jgi:phospholipid/cholesterol/gamma-HCH transport system substrate-binding protein